MKSHLIHVLPVWQACEILGEGVVRRMVSSLLHLRQNSAAHKAFLTVNPSDSYDLEEDLELLTAALLYRSSSNDDSVPLEVSQAWKRWLSARNLALDKSTLISFLVPQTVQPHSGPSGHMGLFDCLVYSLQGHGVSSTTSAYYGVSTGSGNSHTLVWLPDILILLAAAKNYLDFTTRPALVTDPQQQESEENVLEPDDGDENNRSLQDADNDDSNIQEEGSETENDSEPLSVGNVRLRVSSRKSAIAEAKKAREELIEMEERESTSSTPREKKASNLPKSTFSRSPSHNSQNSVIRLASSKRNTQTEGQEAVRTMALVAFRIYDSYQKKGSVTRDTMHRFLTDVYGEDSYKKDPAKSLLDQVFYTESNLNPDALPASDLQASVSESRFLQKILKTFDMEAGKRSHLLLDWLALLLAAMIPPVEISQSIVAYLDTMERRPKPLCEVFQIAESRLFEVKRRFHSLVRAGPLSLIQGDPIGGGDAAAASANGDSNQSQYAMSPNTSSSSSGNNQQPKHVIIQSAFLDAVCKPNSEMGHGGYFPESLAKLVFAAGARNTFGDSSMLMTDDLGDGQIYWSLANVIQFGCMAVRQHVAHLEDQDTPLLRFLFTLFSMTTPTIATSPSDSQKPQNNSHYFDDTAPRVLTREQVEHMLLLMIEHMEFRLTVEAPEDDEFSDHDDKNNGILDADRNDDEIMVDFEPACMLGIVPTRMDRPSSGTAPSFVSLKTLVDCALESTQDGANMTFEEFCAWNTSSPDGGPALRLGSIITDLRLIASVLFGVPPTLASLEISLIAEIERRHKARYPQTNVSRRGPRGTIWYIVNVEWLRTWASRVKDVAGTEEDSNDGRMEVKGGVRGIQKIENASLLTNSTLALRQDIQWKHDYEIVPPLAWHALQGWYDGGPPIHRSVVRYVETNANKTGPHSSPNSKARMPTENEIELYPYFVTVYLCDSSSGGEARPFQQNYQLSRVSPVGVMLVQLCKELDVDPAMARLWVLGWASEGSGSEDDRAGKDWILSLEQNIVEQRKAHLDPTQLKRDISLLLEIKSRETGRWPRGIDGKEWLLREKNSAKQALPDLGDGIVGLYNMGNTCYLNSSIQCISHTPIFREYFTSKAYLNDINTSNPLGYQGQLAQVSAVLINSLWKPFNQNLSPTSRLKRVTAPGSYVMVNANSLTPKTFKDSLGKFNELFAGNEQHDAQELLTFLLAGLSEDLNRIQEKPYIEAPDSDGRPDKELADIWWSNHLKRELSIVVALFQGQYKNLLTCRTCKYESARFEPFSALTVPLPEDDSLTASIILYPFSDKMDATRYCVRVPSESSLGEVLLALAKELINDMGVSSPEVTPQKTESFSIEGLSTDDQKSSDEDVSGERIEPLDPRVVRKARQLCVVDLRDGYIFRNAPQTWLLRDLQNKDTGDLPTFHCYELDDNLEVDDEPKQQEDKDGDEEPVESKPKFAYLAISQRRSELISRDYLHPLSHRLFGTPLLLRLSDISKCTGRRLYDMVATRLRPLVPRGALRFLVSATFVNDSRSNSSTEEKESDGQKGTAVRDTAASITCSMTDSEDISAGPVPRYGFRLRLSSRDGRKCLVCPWYKCCVGCLINDDDTIANVVDGDSLVVDWHFAVDVATWGFGTRVGLLDPIAARPIVGIRSVRPTLNIKTHRSCGIGGKGSLAGAITLEDCLDAFAKEERIPEAYCSKCREFRVQTTRMTLWRLPPILIIHLKRFQFTPTMRRKLRDLVVFPLEGLDLSRIMASDSGETKSIPKTVFPPKKATIVNEDNFYLDDGATATAGLEAEASNLYDLYGVIHHQGALSGGHYVASLKSEIDGQWRLFNDAQIYEIHGRDVIDSSAYILFYMRRDVAQGAQLSDFWDLKQVASMSEEEMDNLVKGKSDRCVIS